MVPIRRRYGGKPSAERPGSSDSRGSHQEAGKHVDTIMPAAGDRRQDNECRENGHRNAQGLEAPQRVRAQQNPDHMKGGKADYSEEIQSVGAGSAKQEQALLAGRLDGSHGKMIAVPWSDSGK